MNGQIWIDSVFCCGSKYHIFVCMSVGFALLQLYKSVIIIFGSKEQNVVIATINIIQLIRRPYKHSVLWLCVYFYTLI